MIVPTDLSFIVSGVLSRLLEVAEKISPHDMSLVDVAALGLTHLNKVVN